MVYHKNMAKLSIIIPVFNETATVREVLMRVLEAPIGSIKKEIIVVDDASFDGTRELLLHLRKKLHFTLILQEKNQGKGAAIRRAMKKTTGDVVIIQDADLEYDPNDYPGLIQPILEDKADVVYGSRFMGGPRRVLFYWHALGNKLLTFLSNIFTNLNLTDMETCYKAFRGELFRSLTISSNRFGFEPEITAKVALAGARVYEVPITYRGRTYEEGKKITWKDGFVAVWAILRFSLFSRSKWKRPGHITLDRMRKMSRYNAYLYWTIKPHLGKRVLEIGSGTGNITKFLLERDLLIASDTERRYLNILQESFGHFRNVRVIPFELGNNTGAEMKKERIDTIVCINVLEHVKDDIAALKSLHRILVPEGKIVLLVPAHQFLYGSLDRTLNHFRRYSKKDLEARLEASSFRTLEMRHVNSFGIPGWFLFGKIFGTKLLPTSPLKIFDIIVPLLTVEEKLRFPFGISLLAVAQK